ncbi:MAG: chemotaxis protein CheW [Oscillospiraceae bacterium]|nr:chemotaxis protein CheW [Oscillospiraceae bacterium]
MPEENGLFAREPDETSSPEENVTELQADKYLICISDGLLYGIDAEQVETIITDHTITRLPRVPHYVRGIINLRGQIIPIIDIRLRLGKPQADEDCIIVVNIGSDCMGILVDGVDKMVDIRQDSILPMPTQNPQKLISGMCSLPDGGTLLILDCGLLLHE